MAQLSIERYVADDSSHQEITVSSGKPFEVRNQGPHVVYVGAVQYGGTQTVNPAYGCPIAPGASVTIPRSVAGDFNVLGVNTAAGLSEQTSSTVHVIGEI